MALKDEPSRFPNCYPQYNPIDAYREHITTTFSKLTGVDEQIIYPVVQWTQTLDKGDLVIPVPALKVKGAKPQDLAEKWAKEVRKATCTKALTAGGC